MTKFQEEIEKHFASAEVVCPNCGQSSSETNISYVWPTGWSYAKVFGHKGGEVQFDESSVEQTDMIKENMPAGTEIPPDHFVHYDEKGRLCARWLVRPKDKSLNLQVYERLERILRSSQLALVYANEYLKRHDREDFSDKLANTYFQPTRVRDFVIAILVHQIEKEIE